MITLFRSLFAPPRHLILMLAALWIGLSLAERRAERHAISKDLLTNTVYYSVLGYIIGGRIMFVIANLSAFIESPLNIFSINPDLFDTTGALVISVLTGFIYGQHRKLALWSTLDALTPLFATLQIGLSLTHLAAGTSFGSPTNLPWGIELWNATRHPSQIYELIASLFILGLLWFRKIHTDPGSQFLLFAALTAGSHLFLEAYRGDSTLIFGGVRLGQVVAWLILALALFASESIRGLENVDRTKSASQ